MGQARETSFLFEEKEGDQLLLEVGKLEILKNYGGSGIDTDAPEKWENCISMPLTTLSQSTADGSDLKLGFMLFFFVV